MLNHHKPIGPHRGGPLKLSVCDIEAPSALCQAWIDRGDHPNQGPWVSDGSEVIFWEATQVNVIREKLVIQTPRCPLNIKLCILCQDDIYFHFTWQW